LRINGSALHVIALPPLLEEPLNEDIGPFIDPCVFLEHRHG
jgi:hypothetical protein